MDVLGKLGADPVVVNNGLNAIASIKTYSTDYLARKIMATASARESGVPAYLVDSLANMQNSDGGWGYQKGYGSTNLETALALQALKSASYSNASTLGAGVSFLKAKVNADGGWSFTSGDTSRVFFTAQAMIALAMLKNDFSVGTQLQNGLNWLATKPHGDGGFGTGSVSNAYETGLAVAAIAGVDTASAVGLTARYYLETTQLVDGSWNNDAYSTATALYGIVTNLGLQGRSVALSRGVNLLGLPLDPIDSTTSSSLLSQIPGCTEIRGWDRDNQAWLTEISDRCPGWFLRYRARGSQYGDNRQSSRRRSLHDLETGP